MIIDENRLHSLWLENEDGEVWTYPRDGMPGDQPEGFIYQHSKFANVLNHRVLRDVLPEEVESCNHPTEHIRKTYGYIDGVEGRKCSLCHGTQTRNIDEDWPEKWSSDGCIELCSGSSSFPVNLALAMARPSLKDRIVALSRGYFRLKSYPLDLAIRIAADSCERCLNVLLYKYGQNDGYREFSKEWHKCNTVCDFCNHLGCGKFCYESGRDNE